MPEIAEIVDVVISASGAGPTKQGFGYGLLLGTHKRWNDRIRQYASLASVSDDFEATDPEYLIALAYFSQSPAPKRLYIGRRSVDAITVTVVTATDGHDYVLTVNGVDYTVSYTDGTPTVNEVATALRALSIPLVTLSGSGAECILTSTVANVAFSFGMDDAKMALSALVASDSVPDDLDAIYLVNKDWYLLLGTDRGSVAQQALALWVSTKRKIHFAPSEEANVIAQAVGADSTTLPAILKAALYDRSAAFYHSDASDSYPDARLAGRILPYLPGGYSPFLKSLTGLTADTLTDTQSGNARDKYANTYETIAGAGRVREGTMASGVFIDRIHGRDKLLTRIEEKVFAALAAPDKVPYTDAGVAILENALKGALDESVADGFLASYEVQVPKVADVDSGDRANRLLPDVTFTAIEAGAIHKVEIRGTVSV